MKKGSPTHLQPIGVPGSCQRSSTTPDVAAKKNSTDLLFMSKAAKKKNQKTLASFFCRKNKNTGRQVLQNKGPNRAYR
jgi:hypothetical protein